MISMGITLSLIHTTPSLTIHLKHKNRKIVSTDFHKITNILRKSVDILNNKKRFGGSFHLNGTTAEQIFQKTINDDLYDYIISIISAWQSQFAQDATLYELIGILDSENFNNVACELNYGIDEQDEGTLISKIPRLSHGQLDSMTAQPLISTGSEGQPEFQLTIPRTILPNIHNENDSLINMDVLSNADNLNGTALGNSNHGNNGLEMNLGNETNRCNFIDSMSKVPKNIPNSKSNLNCWCKSLTSIIILCLLLGSIILAINYFKENDVNDPHRSSSTSNPLTETEKGPTLTTDIETLQMFSCKKISNLIIEIKNVSDFILLQNWVSKCDNNELLINLTISSRHTALKLYYLFESLENILQVITFSDMNCHEFLLNIECKDKINMTKLIELNYHEIKSDCIEQFNFFNQCIRMKERYQITIVNSYVSYWSSSILNSLVINSGNPLYSRNVTGLPI